MLAEAVARVVRGRAHDAELRARVVAEIVAGSTIPAAALKHGVSVGTVKSWWAEDRPVQPEAARTREAMAELIYDTLTDLLTAVRAQLQIAADQEWLKKQTAGEVAELLGSELDRSIRLLAGFRPVEPDPEQLQLERPTVDAIARPADGGAGDDGG